MRAAVYSFFDPWVRVSVLAKVLEMPEQSMIIDAIQLSESQETARYFVFERLRSNGLECVSESL